MQNIYKKLFLVILSISLLSLSSCIKLPEEKVWIDPIFIEEKNNQEIVKTENIENSETWTVLEDNIKTSTWETTSTWEILEENFETWVILNNEEIQTSTWESSIKTSTWEIIIETWTWENL